MGKGENAGNQHILLFLQCFLPYQEHNSSFEVHLTLSQTSFGNIVRKGEIARNKQFLLFPPCFLPIWRTSCHFYQIWNGHLQTLSVWKRLKFIKWERVKMSSANAFKLDWPNILSFGKGLTHSHTMTPFDALGKQTFKNTVGKGEIARNEQFLLFPQYFLPVSITCCHFHQIWNCLLQTLSVWKSIKFVVW